MLSTQHRLLSSNRVPLWFVMHKLDNLFAHAHLPCVVGSLPPCLSPPPPLVDCGPAAGWPSSALLVCSAPLLPLCLLLRSYSLTRRRCGRTSSRWWVGCRDTAWVPESSLCPWRAAPASPCWCGAMFCVASTLSWDVTIVGTWSLLCGVERACGGVFWCIEGIVVGRVGLGLNVVPVATVT
jgi:hypothetical protein